MIKKAFNSSLFSFYYFFLNGCGFKPILIGSDYNFLIKIDSMSGNESNKFQD